MQHWKVRRCIAVRFSAVGVTQSVKLMKVLVKISFAHTNKYDPKHLSIGPPFILIEYKMSGLRLILYINKKNPHICGATI